MAATPPKRPRGRPRVEKPPKKPTGRPPRDFDPKIFEGLCGVCCTIHEIESIFQANKKTIEYWCQRHYKESFDTIYKKHADGGKASLRRHQFLLSKKNATMAIWLGKQWLGQKDLPEVLEEFNGKLASLFDMLNTLKADAVTTKQETTRVIPELKS